jgi:hypothetical protein
MNVKPPTWLGYRTEGGRLELERHFFRNSVAILGSGADEVAASIVCGVVGASLGVGVIDLSGSLAKTVSGYVESFDSSYVMHDSMVLRENAQLHARLIASAYATVLNLPSPQEELLAAAAQEIALEEGEASPMGLVPMIAVVEGFKGPDKTELAGLLATLRFVESAGDLGAVGEFFGSDFLIDFSKAKTTELAETSSLLFLAKLLSMVGSAGLPEVIVINGAERLFRSYTVPRHSCFLRASLVGASFGVVLCATSGVALDRLLIEGCPLRIYSGETWNAMKGDPRVLENMFVLQSFANGSVQAFVPSMAEPLSREGTKGEAEIESDEEIERRILELVASSESPTRTSIVSVLSPEYPADLVAREIDRLQAGGCMAIVRFGQEGGRQSSTLVLLGLGKKKLTELRGDGASKDTM